jgi:hypothetical protein
VGRGWFEPGAFPEGGSLGGGGGGGGGGEGGEGGGDSGCSGVSRYRAKGLFEDRSHDDHGECGA